MIAFHALPLLEAEAKERQREAGEQYGRGMDEKVGEILPQAIDRNPKATDAAAAMIGVSGRYVGFFVYKTHEALTTENGQA